MLGACGGPESSTSETDEGALVPAMETSEPSSGGDVTAMAYCDDVATWDPAWASFEDQVLTLVNQRRAAGATCGGVAKPPVPALTMDARLRCAARKHSRDMATNNFMGHTSSDGVTTPWQRITSAGYTYRAAGENVAAGYSTPAAVVNGWMSSTGHCNNIMSSNFVHLGVGYAYRATGTNYRHYWTQDFGRQ
ncbi:CAP domain-containing protein [Pyxidicoccus fallax]|uniref:CAP domain-containing protein n=2 Tax=Pyxidicoccus fallax TaxID=394095 RepID=A0A848LVV8_9BACT|nr:CAP domain-containing protein [Pyxidicoccus fallax]NPC82796.1 CAP domain-containing protein [Pyxidicoccus fallax]